MHEPVRYGARCISCNAALPALRGQPSSDLHRRHGDTESRLGSNAIAGGAWSSRTPVHPVSCRLQPRPRQAFRRFAGYLMKCRHVACRPGAIARPLSTPGRVLRQARLRTHAPGRRLAHRGNTRQWKWRPGLTRMRSKINGDVNQFKQIASACVVQGGRAQESAAIFARQWHFLIHFRPFRIDFACMTAPRDRRPVAGDVSAAAPSCRIARISRT